MTHRHFRIAILASAACAFGSAFANPTHEADPLTSVRQGLVTDKAVTEPAAEKTLKGPVVAGKGEARTRKSRSAASESINQDFWIFDADAQIFDDFDGDGFFTRIEVTFDADTIYDGANVFAVLYLSLEGGDWIEYGETNVFDIFGASGNDSYFYDTDLISGFPTGYYDVLIELYDDFDGRLVAEFGPAESARLFDLPLESVNNDSVGDPVIVISNEGGGGAGGALSIVALALLFTRRLVRKRLRVADEFSIETN
ncbi:MAG: choice-of-anchor H family protein [Pseudomonadota bacterium]